MKKIKVINYQKNIQNCQRFWKVAESFCNFFGTHKNFCPGKISGQQKDFLAGKFLQILGPTGYYWEIKRRENLSEKSENKIIFAEINSRKVTQLGPGFENVGTKTSEVEIFGGCKIKNKVLKINIVTKIKLFFKE